MVISMPGIEEQAKHLEAVIYNTIPLARAMGLQVTHLTDNAICLEAPVADVNVNIHGTGFAGSIYNVCALSAWGLIHMRLLLEEISADVVLAQAEIRYLLPIKDCIRVECLLDEQEYSAFQKRLLQKGKASITLTVRAREDNQVQATLDARVAVKIT